MPFSFLPTGSPTVTITQVQTTMIFFPKPVDNSPHALGFGEKKSGVADFYVFAGNFFFSLKNFYLINLFIRQR